MRNYQVNRTRRRFMALAAAGLVAASSLLSVPVLANDVGAWRKKVVKTIIKSHIYPRSAISREIEGRAKVKLTITRSGEITGHEVIEATGESVLDDAIPKMVDKMNPLPAPPDALPDANLTFVIPITWRLQ